VQRLRVGTQVSVRLLKAPRPDVVYPVEVLADDGVHVVVRGPWAGPAERDMGFATFNTGDLWTEHYWRDRWYAVKEVVGPDGVRKGWYCDVCRPAVVVDGGLQVADLDLDLWRSADGATILRLDEDEFLDSGLIEREPETAARATAALDELDELARAGFLDLLTW
jgi:hypothetical protein